MFYISLVLPVSSVENDTVLFYDLAGTLELLSKEHT